MKRFWKSLVLPILDVLQPETIIEVGSLEGETTELLLRFCQDHGGTVHGIDPLPRFDVAAWQAEYGEQFQFHQAKSLELLRDLPAADLVLIDGDHNWYTVYHELKQLAEAAATQDRPYPVVLFHDIGWPYARRDLYYDPTDIPPEFRQPYETKGIWPNRSPLHPYGINYDLANATSEGGPRNGVLTAVEDFVAESDEPLRLMLIDGFHGLGILYPANLADHAPATDAYLGKLAVGLEVLGGHLQSMNEQTIAHVVRRNRERLRQEEAAASAAGGAGEADRSQQGGA
jgi:hypothetical protein